MGVIFILKQKKHRKLQSWNGKAPVNIDVFSSSMLSFASGRRSESRSYWYSTEIESSTQSKRYRIEQVIIRKKHSRLQISGYLEPVSDRVYTCVLFHFCQCSLSLYQYAVRRISQHLTYVVLIDEKSNESITGKLYNTFVCMFPFFYQKHETTLSTNNCFKNIKFSFSFYYISGSITKYISIGTIKYQF